MGEGPAMRALVVYESMFGNTERVAGAVAAGLALEDIETAVIDVAAPLPAEVRGADLLVVGAPTHAFSLSRPSTRAEAVGLGARDFAEATGMREWIEALPRDDFPPLAAAFDTRVSKVRYLPACASRRAAHLLSQRGCRMVAPPIGFLVQDVAGPLEPRQLDRAIAWARQVGTAMQRHLATAAR